MIQQFNEPKHNLYPLRWGKTARTFAGPEVSQFHKPRPELDLCFRFLYCMLKNKNAMIALYNLLANLENLQRFKISQICANNFAKRLLLDLFPCPKVVFLLQYTLTKEVLFSVVEIPSFASR